MLPDFDDNGYLPPGVHPATLEEVVARFGQGSPEREAEGKELADFVAWAQTAGIQRLLVDGSFVTAKVAPNDVGVVILLGPEFPLAGNLCRRKSTNGRLSMSLWPWMRRIWNDGPKMILVSIGAGFPEE